MTLIIFRKADNVPIEAIIEHFDAAFKGLGFVEGSKVCTQESFEVLYATKNSGCIRALYANDQKPFSSMSPDKISEFHISFELIGMSEAYQKKIKDLLINPGKYNVEHK